ncbi:MAG: BtaA family protein [Planctomycetes bacterium]|nr:BtaA family protein [Planctomycetota bacterium]
MTETDLAFAQVREDPAIEALLLAGVAAASDRPARALLVCAAGDTALSLLLRPHVGTIDAVDPSPAQRHLCALKLAAALALPRDALHRLVGVSAASEDERLALYARARARLPDDARAHWDARPAQVARGVLQAGRFEALFRELAAAFRADGLEPLVRPDEALACPRWGARFERVFERERLAATFGRAAVDYSMERSFGAHFADVFAGALRRWPAAAGENPFLRQVWEGRYRADLPGGLPDWLEEPGALRRPERLRLHAGRVGDLLPALAAEGAYDLVQTSNVSDWMPVPALEALIDAAALALAPGGALLMRRLNGDHDLRALVARRLVVDPAECERLRADDRSFFYREVVVGRRP